jgi:hypothetical protein
MLKADKFSSRHYPLGLAIFRLSQTIMISIRISTMILIMISQKVMLILNTSTMSMISTRMKINTFTYISFMSFSSYRCEDFGRLPIDLKPLNGGLQTIARVPAAWSLMGIAFLAGDG